MDSLIDLKLVKPLNPSRYIQRIPHFDETFIRYINHPACQINCEGREARPQSPVDVHWEKISPNILENLRERGLVKREQGPWVGIEAYTANQYMAYLASCLGRLPEINRTLITDNEFYFQSIYPEYLPRINPEHNANVQLIDWDYLRLRQDVISLRGLVLSQIFPAPERRIPPEDILDFKRDHRDELNRFRNRIEGFLIGTAAIRDENIRSLMMAQFNREIKMRI